MPVVLSCRTPAGMARRAYLRTRARQLLRALGLEGRELSLSLVGDAEMRALNRTYRRRDRPTDVLAFRLDDEHGRPGPAHRLLGDVVISIDTATAQARALGCGIAARLDALLIHGVLHLIGYDHEVSAAEARRMAQREAEMRAALTPGRPVRRRGRRAAR